jgi:hypothetical protein
MDGATLIHHRRLNHAPDIALDALEKDPSLALCIGIPEDAVETVQKGYRLQKLGSFMIQPLHAPPPRRRHRHHILKRLISDQDLVIMHLVAVTSRIVNRMACVGRAGQSTDWARYAVKNWPVPALKPIKMRSSLKSLFPVPSWRDAARETLTKYHQLIQEIAFAELCYFCEVLNVEKSAQDSPMIHL